MSLNAASPAPTLAQAVTDKQPSTIGSPEQAPQEAQTTQDPLSPKFAILARKEKQLREMRRQIETEKQAMDAQKAQFASKGGDDSSWKQRLAQDPYGVMLEAGLSADQVASLLLNQPSQEDQKLQTLQMKLSAIEKQQQDVLKNTQDSQKQQYEQAKAQIGKDVQRLVQGNAEGFELIQSQGAHDAVVELIEKTFQDDGYLMDLEEACKEVEDYLTEQALGLSKLKKIQAKLAPPQPTEAQKPDPQKPTNQNQTATTLSNRMTTSMAKPMNDRERRDRAVKAFLGQLN